jgi:methanogenic corrinoid protein MtbC1
MVEHLRRPVETRSYLSGARALDRVKDGELALDASRGRRRPATALANKARHGAGNAILGTLESGIIPRLVLAFRDARPAPVVEADKPAVIEFCRVVLNGTIDEALEFVEGLRAHRQTLETIYVELFEPAAHRLGELWNADAVDFVKVTMAVMRMQNLLHHFGLDFRHEIETREHGRRALLMPAPGERGSFGYLMFGAFELALAAEFLRRDGWDAFVDSSASRAEAVDFVDREWFDVIELSLSSESHLDELTAAIRHIRRASRNGALAVMVGGPVFKDHPEMVARVGADVVATGGRQAAAQAYSLMEQLKTR